MWKRERDIAGFQFKRRGWLPFDGAAIVYLNVHSGVYFTWLIS